MSNLILSSVDEEFVPYEEALALKELGFDEPCFAYWDDDEVFELNADFLKGSEMDSTWLTRPTFSQAFRWFRDKYEVDKDINVVFSKSDDGISFKQYKALIPFVDELYINVGLFTSYEEAEFECLLALIDIAKEKNEQQ